MTQTYDVFRLLSEIDSKNIEFYDTVDDSDKKDIVPVLLSRWTADSSSVYGILVNNEYVNPYTYPLYKHPSLLWKLLTLTGAGRPRRHKWVKRSKHTNKPISVEIIKQFHGMSTIQAEQSVDLLTYDQLVDMAYNLGYQTAELTKLSKEHNGKGKGKTTKN